ncbi:extracellular catalytic domain type 1 short-chain-length polyhydroxyalkanoate depolymerase [Fibrella arboris]|uniref:extracellular catalytic domain type 1 short-chain-length polyhydroxyalkanoate depolymerase n=1 Tax=Fibrella arboris TaxID=3242486 RepID=UPI003520B515
MGTLSPLLLTILLPLMMDSTIHHRQPSFSSPDTLHYAGLTRTYRIYIPSSYSKRNHPLPLVVALHGGGGSGQQFEAQSKLSETADTEGFIVVYPDGRQNSGMLKLRTWNAGACCGQSASTQQTDDVGFIRSLIDKLQATYQIDPKRVYATGHSNGAMLCYRLACELPDKLAAIAANAGTMQLKTACQPSRIMPILHIHSKQDRHVPPDGGVGSQSLNRQWNPSVDTTLSVFAKLAHCTTTKQVVRTTAGYTLYEWMNCQDNTPIQYYLTNDGGHSWPGGQQAVRRFGDPPSAALANNELIWTFFKNRALP